MFVVVCVPNTSNTDVSGSFGSTGGLLSEKIWPKIDQVTPFLVKKRPPLSSSIVSVAIESLFCDYKITGRLSYAAYVLSNYIIFY